MAYTPTSSVISNVEFFNDSKFARTWQWSFGETTTVDGNDRKETYTYTSPGKKTVLLVVNEDRRHEAKRILTVLPPAKKAKRARNRDITTPIADVLVEIPDAPIEDAPPTVEVVDDGPVYVEISSEQIQDMLVKYSKRNLDDVAIRKYFSVSNIPVYNKKGDRFTVSQFFQTIRDVKNLDIKSIKLFRSEETGLIKSMTVDMRYKNTLFWKSF